MYSKKVLLVDDSLSDRKLFMRHLENSGFRVLATNNPQDAIAAIVSGDVGCVVTDQMMPMTGQELVELVKGVRSDIGIVFLSGAPLTITIPEGAIAITKDDPAKLVNAVQECMRRWLK